MKALLSIVGTIVALAAVFVGMPMLLLDVRTPSAGPAPAIVRILTEENIARSTSLSSGDRQAAIEACVADVRKERKPGVVDAANTERARADVIESATSTCDCMINTLEDTTETLEFVLAMSMHFIVAEELDPGKISIGEPNNHRSVAPYATKLGVADSDFNRSSIKALEAVMAASSKCRDRT